MPKPFNDYVSRTPEKRSSFDHSTSKVSRHTFQRSKIVLLTLYLFLFGIGVRLFYWQVFHSSVLQAEAESQYTRTVTLPAQRGKIFTSDGYTLAGNKNVYRLFAQPHLLKEDPVLIADKLAPLLLELDPVLATDAAIVALQKEELRQRITEKLSDPSAKWVTLKQRLDGNVKQQVESLNFFGLGFERYQTRVYPEASLSAHALGFVGKDAEGNDQGYFGVEGALDKELHGYAQKNTFLKDALGLHLLFDTSEKKAQLNGRDIVLTIRRDVQNAVEETLKKGMEKYGAASGEVIVMEPSTGKILALAAFPNYNPENFYDFESTSHKNPVLAETYEPGSTFKVLTVAAAIDLGLIKEDTICTNCDQPRKINQYTIRTWNDEYHPNITIKDALAKSDNIAMIFIAELMGEEKFPEYIKKFGIGEEIKVELQEDTATPVRKEWKQIDVATSSFGQGVATTAMQMVRAVGAIANHGKMMRPTIVEKVIDHQQGSKLVVEPIEERQVVSEQTAKTVSEMMVYAASQGEAKWISSKTHSVAGKTGTAQIPIDGHYDAKKTIASFIGFAPADNPRFIMIVKLREPSSSPWASETAAPLWYDIASKLYLLLNIPPDR